MSAPAAIHSQSVLSEDLETLGQAVVDDHYRDRDITLSEHAETRVTAYLRHSGSRLWMDLCERVGERATAIVRTSRPPLDEGEETPSEALD